MLILNFEGDEKVEQNIESIKKAIADGAKGFDSFPFILISKRSKLANLKTVFELL
jgi:hypothetical protein